MKEVVVLRFLLVPARKNQEVNWSEWKAAADTHHTEVNKNKQTNKQGEKQCKGSCVTVEPSSVKQLKINHLTTSTSTSNQILYLSPDQH